jgi:hypothetical protein
MYMTAIGGHLVMVEDVVNGQYQQELHQLNLKYYQVEAQVAHQVVTMTTELVDRAETTL